MSAQPVTRERQPRHLVADVPQSLDALAAAANRELALCEQTLAASLVHAARCGEALLKAREQVAAGEWMRWLLANFHGSQSSASNYMRIATYRDKIDPASSLREAVAAIAGMPNVALPRENEVREAAVAALDGGASLTEVAERVGVSPTTVFKWKNPEKVRGYQADYMRRRRAAAAALERVEREREIKRAVRKAGAALAEAYSMSARMSGVLAQAEQEATSDDVRAALEDAREHYHKMSDAIVRALGVS